jgi:hypothetical protein
MRKAVLFGVLLIVLGVASGGLGGVVLSRASESKQRLDSHEAAAAKAIRDAAEVGSSDPQRAKELLAEGTRRTGYATEAADEYSQRRLSGLLFSGGAAVLVIGGVVLLLVGRRRRPAAAAAPWQGTPQAGYGPPPGYGAPPPQPGYGTPPGHGQALAPPRPGQPPAAPGYGQAPGAHGFGQPPTRPR